MLYYEHYKVFKNLSQPQKDFVTKVFSKIHNDPQNMFTNGDISSNENSFGIDIIEYLVKMEFLKEVPSHTSRGRNFKKVPKANSITSHADLMKSLKEEVNRVDKPWYKQPHIILGLIISLTIALIALYNLVTGGQ